MPKICIRYWAGAKQAAGHETELVEAESCQAALDHALAVRSPDQRLARILAASSFLVEGVARRRNELAQPETSDVTLEVLPPFAGG